MANAITLINQSGPLPIEKTFSAPSDGPMILFVSGSAWSNAENSWISVEVLLDGNAVGQLSVFCNFRASHQALVPIMIPFQTSFGDHTVMLQVNGGNTISDLNDAY